MVWKQSSNSRFSKALLHRTAEHQLAASAITFAQVIMTKAESADIKKLRNRGLQLLGFKPLSCLQAFHQVSNAHFLYPDEKSLQGSTAAFTALHTAMADKARPQMALARLVRREGDMSVLVALLPQEERFEEGTQVQEGAGVGLYI